MSGQHSTNHSRGVQNTMRHQGLPSDQQHIHLLDQEQLAFFSIHKPLNVSSWDDVTPVHHRLSTSDIRKALSKLHQNPRNTVKDTLMSLKSESARRLINALVQEQNERESDSNIEWIIAGIDVKKEIVKQWPSQKKVIKSIEVILKTEPTHDFNDDSFGSPPLRGPFEGGVTQTNQSHRNVNQHGPGMGHVQPHIMHQQPPMGAQPIQVNGHERGEHMHGRQDLPHPPHYVQGGSHFQQPHSMLPVPQHPGGGVGIPPPPPPHGGPVKQTQVVQPPFDPQQQPMPMPGSFPEVRPAPQFMPQPEILDPRVLKHQKSKSKNLRREFQEVPMVYAGESDSDSSGSDIGSQFSSRSVEDGAYGFIERSRSRGRNRSHGIVGRSHSRGKDRSHSRGRERGMPKIFKVKKSHGRSRSDVEVIHEGKHSPSSKSSSPRSSASALPTQQIFNIHIDNDNDRERERKDGHGRDAHAANHDQRRNNKPMHSPGFTNPIYTKRDKFDVHPMSRHSSVGGSDTGSSVIDGHSSIYTSDDSVFSEPIRPRMHSRTTSEVGGGLHLRSRNMPIPRHDAFIPAHQESHRRQKRHFEADDYPHRPRGSIYDGYAEPPHTPSFRQPPMAPRRHSVQLSNPFDPRHPAQPSRSYTDYATQPFQQRYITDNAPEPFEFRAMADELGAMNYINQSRRSGLTQRRNSLRGRGAPEVDEWAYRPQGRMHDAYRHMY
ncbi:uncharacterized protein CC84DRAFT_1178473 [Paraphaeosphaeria sporulosa]|uniref:Uncharacterized protein n=1 Tax=Paraphaeosphaeria sporulosa TaxID=1460663 RepID=A0A177C5W2_9PLEO|nr:uncharacterized protein CC84DRAFT_1178473 [Paraphaeosphaeria sporulosa]OAG02905.1 hypothetical protein CC84DRAFT_1178473 [Paraphaeosphaeria sporulosa]